MSEVEEIPCLDIGHRTPDHVHFILGQSPLPYRVSAIIWICLGFLAWDLGCAVATVAEVFALACQHHQLGNFAHAEHLYRLVIQSNPSHVDAHANLALALAAQRKLAEAESGFRQVAGLRPGDADAHNNLGNALADQGKLDEAAASYLRALALHPRFASAHYNLGNTLKKLDKLDEAAASYRQALLLNPDYDMAHVNLGNMFLDQHDLAQAIGHYESALRLNPRNAEAHTNLGVAKAKLGRLDEAVACHRFALELRPDLAQIHLNLAGALSEQERLPDAIACFRRALQLNPDQLNVVAELVHKLQIICVWKDLEGLAQRVIQAVENDAARSSADAVPPFSFLALPPSTTANQQLQCARKWVEQRLKPSDVRSPMSEVKNLPSSTSDIGHRTRDKITVGYLSGDFHEHAVAYLAAELIEKHERQQFRVYGYSYDFDDRSPTRRRLEKAFDRFADLQGQSFPQAAQRILADEVDILVDLTGYTGHARTQIMAMRPAPIQVNFLGYPGTLGAPFIDYIVVDEFVVPPDQQHFFAEKVVYLPGCYQVNDSNRQIAAQTPSRAACGLPETGFVFCCFNMSFKITPDVFEIWMRLLRAIPGSVLWLGGFNPFAPANLRAEAQARGVAAERLVFAPRLPQAEHLARYRLADLFLDTVPYGAHTTASDALWAGCPVLTIVGQTFPTRVAGSLLRTLGLPELITTSFPEYEPLALRLAQDTQLLGALRDRLEANRHTSGLFDGARFARDLEQAYGAMWQIHTAGDQPRGFAVSRPTKDKG
jgi:protein O-GlcNAc transferase